MSTDGIFAKTYLNHRKEKTRWITKASEKAAQSYIPDMTKFLRDLIAIPSESCEEEGVIKAYY